MYTYNAQTDRCYGLCVITSIHIQFLPKIISFKINKNMKKKLNLQILRFE